jgi:ubiquinone/menaquinone biosynthesis C-methylase UbiE
MLRPRLWPWVAVLLALAPIAQARPAADPKHPGYTTRSSHDPNGTGRFYMGREIAQVMGHEAAAWLDRPEREEEEAPSVLLRHLGLRPGMLVADIGAGSGYLTLPMAKRVRPGGTVFAVEIQQEMLDIIAGKMKSQNVPNVRLVLGDVQDPRLPAGKLDLILLVDVYHEFSHPYEMTRQMVRALKPGGRLVLVEYRKEDPTVPIKEVHKMSEAQVRREMSIWPLRHERTLDVLPWQHVIIFRKTAPR